MDNKYKTNVHDKQLFKKPESLYYWCISGPDLKLT